MITLIIKKNQLLQLCTARTVWSDVVFGFGSFRQMHFSDGDPIGKPRMIHRQTSFDFKVLTEGTGVIRALSVVGDQ